MVPRLLADIGGTNARFALQRPGRRPGRAVVLRCHAFPTIEAATGAAIEHLRPAAPPRAAAIAVAAPVLGDAIAMTNHPWRFSQAALARALGLDRLVVLNDLAAVAHALPHLRARERRPIGAEPPPAADAPLAVIGPGTGLGIAALVPAAGRWIAVPGEGGHADLAPGTAREDAVLAALRRRFGHVSLERALSGPGLVNLYRALDVLADAPPPRRPPARTPAAITGRARARTCPRAIATAALFSALLGGAAGNLALTLGARGGVYVAGGIVPRMGTAFDAAAFRRRFEAKGRFADYLAAVPTWLVTAPQPALIGLAAALDAGR